MKFTKILLINSLLFCFGSLLSAQSVTETGSMREARYLHQSQMLNNGEVLVFGGRGSNWTTTLRSAELYTTATGIWRPSGSMIIPREAFASAKLPNGNVLAIGGIDYDYNSFASCEIYNATSQSWSYAASMNVARSNHSCVVLNDGRILVAGGYPLDEPAEIYDPATNSWSYTGAMATSHGEGMGLVVLKDGNVLATGGWSDMSATEIYNPTTNSWTAIADMAGERYQHGVILLNNGKVLLSGSAGFFESDAETSELFDPVTKTFSYVAGVMSDYRTGNELVLLNNGNVLVFGMGNFFNPTDTKSIEIFDVATSQWKALDNCKIGWEDYRIHKLQNGKILVLGGALMGNILSGCVLIDDNTVANGVNNTLSDTGIQVYNNGKSLYVSSENNITGLSWKLYDLSGKCLLSDKQLSEGLIDVSGMIEGVYIFKIEQNGIAIYSDKVIITK